MRILTGFSPPSRGTAIVAGYDIKSNPIEVKRRVGYLPENVPLYGEMLVSKFLQYVAEVKGVAPRAPDGGGGARDGALRPFATWASACAATCPRATGSAWAWRRR